MKTTTTTQTGMWRDLGPLEPTKAPSRPTPKPGTRTVADARTARHSAFRWLWALPLLAAIALAFGAHGSSWQAPDGQPTHWNPPTPTLPKCDWYCRDAKYLGKELQTTPPTTAAPSSTGSTASNSTGTSAVSGTALMLKTKCSRNEITAATCAKDGFSGGRPSTTAAPTGSTTVAHVKVPTFKTKAGATTTRTPAQREASAMLAVKTKCSRDEVSRQACAKDGFPGGS